MKKILFTILISIFGVMSSKAQEIDSLQLKSDSITVENLAASLKKLQRDYDFLSCDYELNKMQLKLEILANNIMNNSIDLQIDCYHYSGKYMKELCLSCSDNYNASVELLNSLKETITQLKAMVSNKIISSDFSEDEINLLNHNCNTLDIAVRCVEKSLANYKVNIDWFKDKSSLLN